MRLHQLSEDAPIVKPNTEAGRVLVTMLDPKNAKAAKYGANDPKAMVPGPDWFHKDDLPVPAYKQGGSPLNRTARHLEKLGLVDFTTGAQGTIWIKLTPKGKEVATDLANTTTGAGKPKAPKQHKFKFKLPFKPYTLNSWLQPGDSYIRDFLIKNLPRKNWRWMSTPTGGLDYIALRTQEDLDALYAYADEVYAKEMKSRMAWIDRIVPHMVSDPNPRSIPQRAIAQVALGKRDNVDYDKGNSPQVVAYAAKTLKRNGLDPMDWIRDGDLEKYVDMSETPYWDAYSKWSGFKNFIQDIQ
jgi:DNA-binding MarR family transcriptional regulator